MAGIREQILNGTYKPQYPNNKPQQTSTKSKPILPTKKEDKKKLGFLGKIGKETVSLSNRIGEGALDIGNAAFDAITQASTSNLNPYYWFNQDKLKGHQDIARDLIKESSVDTTKKALGYTPEVQQKIR